MKWLIMLHATTMENKTFWGRHVSIFILICPFHVKWDHCESFVMQIFMVYMRSLSRIKIKMTGRTDFQVIRWQITLLFFLNSIGISPAQFPANQEQAKQTLTNLSVSAWLAWKIGSAKLQCCTKNFWDLSIEKPHLEMLWVIFIFA